MPRFKPIKQLRISEEVAEQLKQSIVSGHFKPGEKLPPERDLAEEFHVSRVAIREASSETGACRIYSYSTRGNRWCLCDRSKLRISGKRFLRSIPR